MRQWSLAIESFGDLIRRYALISRQAWIERQSEPQRRPRHELEFLPAQLELAETPPHPAPLWTGRLLSGLVLIVALLAAIGRIDIVATASGKVVPSGQTKVIASVDTAKVRAIHVVEGQKVKAGDLLLELDATPLLADRDKATAEEFAARLQMARSRALLAAIHGHTAPRLESVSGVDPVRLREAQRHLEGQYADFAAKLADADAEIAQYRQALPSAQEREKIYGSLLAQKDVSRDAWLEKEQARIDIESHLADAEAKRASLVAQTRREALDALSEGAKAAETASEDALHAGSHAAWLILRSPIDGTVQQLTVHTVSGVVQGAEPLMRIVPDAPRVEVDAWLENKDIGFVAAGQAANVKVKALDYTKYGTVPGHVELVSRDAVEDKNGALRYTVRLLLDRSSLLVEGHPVALSPGMAVNVDIKTGRRRVLDYFLSPLLRQEHESLHER